MKRNSPAQRVATLGVFLALALVLSLLESLIPPIPGMPPNSKLGLSNLVVMYSLFFIDKGSTFTLVFLKSGFVFLATGSLPTGFLSLSGGFSSILIIMLLSSLFKNKLSYLVLSVFGAVFHNLGQLLAAMLLFRKNIVFFYLPIMLILGVIMGTLTGLLLKIVFPTFQRFTPTVKK